MDAKDEGDDWVNRSMRRLFDECWTPLAWARTAENLRRAAAILFSVYNSSRAENGEPLNEEDIAMDAPATLLFGYALENAIKGYLVKTKNISRSNYNKVPGWSAHDLTRLLEITG